MVLGGWHPWSGTYEGCRGARRETQREPRGSTEWCGRLPSLLLGFVGMWERRILAPGQSHTDFMPSVSPSILPLPNSSDLFFSPFHPLFTRLGDILGSANALEERMEGGNGRRSSINRFRNLGSLICIHDVLTAWTTCRLCITEKLSLHTGYVVSKFNDHKTLPRVSKVSQ